MIGPVSIGGASRGNVGLAISTALLVFGGCAEEGVSPQDAAVREIEQALELKPNTEMGLRVYRSCAKCHQPEGWGLADGSMPQIAGQHHNVVIKQLADFRAGTRDEPSMCPLASAEKIGGAQAVADVTAYIDTLEISVENGKGPGDRLERGQALYRDDCASCHGPEGEGDNDSFMPRIQAQHYAYLVRQFELIRDGKRRNADPEMTALHSGFSAKDIRAVSDYVSRLQPPVEFQAPKGWRNPDFPD